MLENNTNYATLTSLKKQLPMVEKQPNHAKLSTRPNYARTIARFETNLFSLESGHGLVVGLLAPLEVLQLCYLCSKISPTMPLLSS